MSRIQWETEDRRFEHGVDRGVLYLKDGTVVPWNGLTDIKEKTTNTIGKGVHIDGVKRYYQNDASDFSASLSAYTYPDEFERCDGVLEIEPGFLASQQSRETFNLSYRTRHTDVGYKIHLVYTGTAAPSSKNWTTQNDSPDPSTFDWDISTVPMVSNSGIKTAHVFIDSLEAWPTAVAALEDRLYGTATTPPSFPTLDEIVDIFENNALFVVIDNGDGSWTATGPDDVIRMLDATTFEIEIDSAIYIDEVTYTLSTF